MSEKLISSLSTPQRLFVVVHLFNQQFTRVSIAVRMLAMNVVSCMACDSYETRLRDISLRQDCRPTVKSEASPKKRLLAAPRLCRLWSMLSIVDGIDIACCNTLSRSLSDHPPPLFAFK